MNLIEYWIIKKFKNGIFLAKLYAIEHIIILIEVGGLLILNLNQKDIVRHLLHLVELPY